MNQQNTSDKDTTKTGTSQKNDHELATALRAMALATQDLSPIFKLNVDCWEEIFDWLSLADVHAFGQTCKFFYRIAGKYFEWKYRRVLGRVHDNSMDVFDGFTEFVQRLSFYNCDPDTSLLYALIHCKSPTELTFVNASSTSLDIDRLEKMLSRVEVLRFMNSFISEEFMESILKLCATNLKRFRSDRSNGFGWTHHKYPKLQHLELYEFDSSAELIKFFEQNPHVRSFTTVAEKILKYQREFGASNIKLDDLTVLENSDIDAISTALIDLFKRGFYKRLHFVTHTEQHLVELPALTTLHIGTYDYIKMPYLPTVTCLSFTPLWNGVCSWMDMNNISNALVNLKCILMYTETNLRYMMPFIRNSKKLKEIKIEYFRNDEGEIDPVVMNSEREKLNGATKMVIYTEEEDYLRIKWIYNKSDFGLIEIKRLESYDGVWNNRFA